MAERWPALMRRKTAAEYVDMSEPAFEREVIAGRFPASIQVGNREHWRRDAIDAAIARLSGEDAVPEYRRKLQEKYGKAA